MPNQQSSTGQLYHPSMSPFVSQAQNENQESNQPNLSYAMAFPGIREYYQVRSRLCMGKVLIVYLETQLGNKIN